MRQRIIAITESLILHKTTRYFVENRNENTNKQALLQRSRAAYVWGMDCEIEQKTYRSYARPITGGVCILVLWGIDAPGDCRQLVANCVHTADVTQLDS